MEDQGPALHKENGKKNCAYKQVTPLIKVCQGCELPGRTQPPGDITCIIYCSGTDDGGGGGDDGGGDGDGDGDGGGGGGGDKSSNGDGGDADDCDGEDGV